MHDQLGSPSSSRMLARYLTDIEQLLDEQHGEAALREAFDLPRIAVALTDPEPRCWKPRAAGMPAAPATTRSSRPTSPGWPSCAELLRPALLNGRSMTIRDQRSGHTRAIRLFGVMFLTVRGSSCVCFGVGGI